MPFSNARPKRTPGRAPEKAPALLVANWTGVAATAIEIQLPRRFHQLLPGGRSVVACHGLTVGPTSRK